MPIQPVRTILTHGDEQRAMRRLAGKRSKALGRMGEQLVEHWLNQRFFLVEKIETGWRVQRMGGKIVGATPLARVSGDFRAVDARGKAVLVECKVRDDALPWSALDQHQHTALKAFSERGAHALIAWVNPVATPTHPSLVVCYYRTAIVAGGWAQRHSLTWDTACKVAVHKMGDMP